MKTQTIVTDITHDDLVTLLCSATKCSSYIEIGIPNGHYTGTDLENKDDCREDKWAKVLLAGRTLFFYDLYAEDKDEFYGTLPHKFYDKHEYFFMRYEFSLETIKSGLAKALSSQSYISDYARHIYEDDGINLDLTEAEALMQYIIFGEEIYG